MHLSDQAAHDPDRSAQGRMGPQRDLGRPSDGKQEGVRVRIVDVGDDETANVVAPGRSFRWIARFSREPSAGGRRSIKNDSTAIDRRRQGDPARR